jgi:hypothetical protein
VLYDVKLYQSKREFIADQNKEFALSTYSDRKYGFLIRDAKRFDKSIPLTGQLGFFNTQVCNNHFKNRYWATYLPSVTARKRLYRATRTFTGKVKNQISLLK